MMNLNAESLSLPASRAKRLELLGYLEEKKRRESQRQFKLQFETLYDWQRKFNKATADNTSCMLMAANRVGKTRTGLTIDAAHLLGDYPGDWEGHRFSHAPLCWLLGYSMEKTRDLHQGPGMLVLPNPWDAGSAKMLASLGFDALATTSAGLAFSLGRRDAEGAVSRTEALENARAIVAATDLPVAADLENGYGDAPQDCATTIRLAAEAGLVGGSIEDASGRAGQPIYEFSAALERVAAAVEAARALPFPFTLCARAENFLHGREDLDDTLRRLRAYADAGADVLYAPGLNRREQIVAVLEAVAPKPVNVLVGSPRLELSLDELEALGVKRVSLGSNLARVAFGAFHQAAQALARRDLEATRVAMPFDRINDLFR